MKNKFHIKSESIILQWDDAWSNYASARTVHVEFEKHSVPIVVDERVNDIFPVTNKKYTQLKYIIEKYETLKFSDFRYRIGDGYEGMSLRLETFIEFLKTEERDLQLNKILQC